MAVRLRHGSSHERLAEQAQLLDLSNDAILVRDAQDRITYWSQGAEVEYGYTADEALGKVSHELLETVLPLPLAVIDQILDRTGGWGGEIVQTRKDGTKGTYLSRWILDRDSSGRRRSVLGCNTNISERKSSAEAIQRGEARLRAVLETAVDAIITIDEHCLIQSVNPATERMFGYAAAEMIGQNINMLMPSPYREEHDGYLMRYLRTGERRIIGIGREVQGARKDGTVFPIDLAVSEVESGKLFTGIIRDITQRKRSEETIRQSESRLRALLETAVDAIITIDELGRMQSVNAATTRIFGYAASEMLGQNVSMLMPSPYQEEHDEFLVRYLKTGEKRIIGIGREVHARRKDGSVFPIDLAVSEVEPGKLFTGIIRDISDRKMGELRLREADRMASIGTLAAGLGHDMNNVLLPVRAYLDVLKAEAELPHPEGSARAPLRKSVGACQKIEQSIAYLQQLADGLHFLAMDPETDDNAGGVTDLQAWWEQTSALLRKAVPKHVKVSMSIAKGLPEVAVTAHALTQAVLNLIVNAGEAIPSGRKRRQGHVRLTARHMAQDRLVKLSITDNGTGMTEEVKRRAFDMFFTTKSRGLGTGLGLAMVRKFIDGAGGSIEVESALGKGTTISLLLPEADNGNSRSALVAAIHLADSRAASIIRTLLEVSGVHIDDDGDQNQASIWVIEPTASNLQKAREWRTEQPRGCLMLIGRPDQHSAAAWNELEPITIEEPDDLEAVQFAIGVAISELKGIE